MSKIFCYWLLPSASESTTKIWFDRFYLIYLPLKGLRIWVIVHPKLFFNNSETVQHVGVSIDFLLMFSVAICMFGLNVVSYLGVFSSCVDCFCFGLGVLLFLLMNFSTGWFFIFCNYCCCWCCLSNFCFGCFLCLFCPMLLSFMSKAMVLLLLVPILAWCCCFVCNRWIWLIEKVRINHK